MEFLAPGFRLAQSLLLRAFRVNQEMEMRSLPPFILLSYSAFPINKILFKGGLAIFTAHVRFEACCGHCVPGKPTGHVLMSLLTQARGGELRPGDA